MSGFLEEWAERHCKEMPALVAPMVEPAVDPNRIGRKPDPPAEAEGISGADWKPKARMVADSAESEATEPSKPGLIGFEGATSAESPEIEEAPNPAELARASAVLRSSGVRIMALEGGTIIGVWSDLDGPEVRAALRIFGTDELPVRYLDGAGVPIRYKVRRVEGEPVPTSVLVEMELHPEEPWKVRDRMLIEMGWCLKGPRRGMERRDAERRPA
jgi:hypothetical protein